MTAIDEKIHPHLSRSLEETRRRLLAGHAEAALRFELADERIEEREYDEKERLRVRLELFKAHQPYHKNRDSAPPVDNQ